MPFEVEHHHYVHLDEDARRFLRRLVRPVKAGINRLELKMSEISDQLDADIAKADAASSVLAAIAADVAVLLAAVPAGVFSAEEQAKADALAGKLDALGAALAALDADVPDADGSDAPSA